MIYFIIILVLVVGLIEFIIIRKGMKAGKRSSSYLRSGTGSSPSNPLINKRVQQKEVQPESFLEQESLVKSADRGEKIISFPEQSREIDDSSDIKREIRQKESPVREQSALDIIQEIRGESVHSGQDSYKQSQEFPVNEVKQEEIDEIEGEDEEELIADVKDVDNKKIREVGSKSEEVDSEESAMFDEREESPQAEKVVPP